MARVLRLFQVRDASTNKVLPPTFNDKAHAKQYRDELNASHNAPYVLTYGPDHHKYKD